MDNNLEKIRHSLSHVMALAVKELWPDVLLGIGPAIDNGFYYDFDFKDKKIKEDDLIKIQEKMKEIIKNNLKFKSFKLKIDEAVKQQDNQEYKKELLIELKQQGNKEASYYELNGFSDLCKGPHVKSLNEIDINSFKVYKISGAYWRGNENNKMLTRIYGLAFNNKKELDDYFVFLKEAEKRDHRKLGQQLDLFHFSELIGPGLPIYTIKGTIIIEELQKKIESICRNYGFQKVRTPHLAKEKLYDISGHTKKFSEELFRVSSNRNHEFVIRPVLCPHHTQIYNSKPRSYRDLPIRYMESDKMYRAEKAGEVGGLNRVYAITVEDGHCFCRIDQIKQEIKSLINIIKDFYSLINLWGNHKVYLSVRDYNNLDKYIGENKDWDLCEKILQQISDEMNLEAQKQEGEAAIYGPKLDFMFQDALGKQIQIPTVQIDFATPKRFNLFYINEKGNKENPVIIHRAILGSYERFLALLIEHYAGAFPFWLTPTQIKILSVSDAHNNYCLKLKQELLDKDLRVEVDLNNETINSKIRTASQEKIPYVLVIGDKEINSDNLSVRQREDNKIKNISKRDFINQLQELLTFK